MAPETTAAEKERVKALARREKVPLILEEPPIDQLKPRIEPLVIDAVNKLEQYGIPLFREVARLRGIDWESDRRGLR